MDEKKAEIPKPKKKRKWLWPAIWLTLLSSILVVEGIAIALPGEDDTLSEQVWNLVDFLQGGGFLGKLGIAGLTIGVCGLFGWLILHFFTRKV